jgi:hypothetical protein
VLAKIALPLLLLAGCATLKNDQTVCPESRSLRCGTNEVCTFDNQRGCRVCRCDEPLKVSNPDRPALPPP